MSEQAIRLTQYSHGAGCGCKISPKVLETILHSEQAKFVDPNLLVGNETSDDAAVYDLGNGTSIVSTTDFFMPIVDNPFDFGRIAATNAISDIFAMGGKPIMAIAILGWPINTWRRKSLAKWWRAGALPASRRGSRWRAATPLTPRSRSSVWRSPAWCPPSASRKTAPPVRVANCILLNRWGSAY